MLKLRKPIDWPRGTKIGALFSMYSYKHLISIWLNRTGVFINGRKSKYPNNSHIVLAADWLRGNNFSVQLWTFCFLGPFLLGDNHQQLTSRFEAALRQQQHQQQSRQLYNRRKADSICFSSAARLNSGLLVPTSNTSAVATSLTNTANPLKSHIGQLGSPPPPPTGDLCCQQMSKSYGNTPQKFARVSSYSTTITLLLV